MRAVALLLAVLSLTGCRSWLAARIDPATSAFEASRRDEVWDRARAELARRGFELDRADRAQGQLRTAQLRQPGNVPCGVLSCWYRDEVEITVTPAGTATVRVARETAVPSLIPAFADWYPVASTQKTTIATVVAYQDELLRAITPPGAARPEGTAVAQPVTR